MALIVVGDVAGDATAESYTSEAEFVAYWANRTLDPVYIAAGLATATTTQIEEALRITTQELDAENEALWKGSKATEAQALDWNRIGATDDSGFAFSSTVLPVELTALTNERAARYIANIATGMIPDQEGPSGAVEMELLQAGPVKLQTKYTGGATQANLYPKLETLLIALIDYDGTSVIRA